MLKDHQIKQLLSSYPVEDLFIRIISNLKAEEINGNVYYFNKKNCWVIKDNKHINKIVFHSSFWQQLYKLSFNFDWRLAFWINQYFKANIKLINDKKIKYTKD